MKYRAARLGIRLAGLGIVLGAVAFQAGTVAAGAEDRTPTVRHANFGTAVDARNRSVMPLTVTVANPGPAVEAELRAVSPGEHSGQRYVLRRSLILPADSLSQVTFPYYADVPDRRDTKTPGIHPGVDLELGDGRHVRWGRYQTLGRIYPAEQRAAVIMDSRAASYSWLETKDGVRPSLSKARYVIPPQRMPRTASALSFADLVVVGSVGGHRPDEAQIEALSRWIASGGVAVWVPSPDTVPGQWGRLEAAFPGVWLGGGQVETLPIPGHDEILFADSEGLWRAPLVRRSGDVLIGPEEDPLAVSGRYGAGRIVMLGFDAGAKVFQEADRAESVWAMCVPDAPGMVRRGNVFSRHNEPIQELMRRMAGVPVASRLWMRGYLLVLLGGFFLLLVGSHLARRPEWGWVGSVFFAVLAGWLLLRVTGREVPDQPGWIEIVYARADPGGGGVTLEGGLGFFSPRDTVFRAALPDDGGYVVPGRTGIRPAPVFESSWEAGRQVTGDLRVRARELRYASGFVRLAPFPIPSATLAVGPDGLRVEMGNTPGLVLEDVFLRWNRLSVPLGRDAARGSAAGWIRPESKAEGFRLTGGVLRQETDEMRAVLSELVLDASETWGPLSLRLGPFVPDAPDATTPAVYAFTSRPVWPWTETVPDGLRQALVLWRFPLELELDDAAWVWPRGTLPRTLTFPVSIGMESADGRVEGAGLAELLFEFQLPTESPPMRLDRIRVFFQAEGDTYDRVAELLPGGAGDVPGFPLRNGITVLDEAERFRDVQGRIRVRVRFSPRPGVDSPLQRPWVVTDMELELAGRPLRASGEEPE